MCIEKKHISSDFIRLISHLSVAKDFRAKGLMKLSTNQRLMSTTDLPLILIVHLVADLFKT